MSRGTTRHPLERRRPLRSRAAQPGQLTDEEKAENACLCARHDELVNMDKGDWTEEELVAEGGAIETRLDEIEATLEARAVYRPQDAAVAGCIVTLGRDG